jgi:DNA-binding SARP family transcriptional activator
VVDRRLDLLPRVLRHRLTLVVAGAGWGKSELLRRWAAAVPSVELSTDEPGATVYTMARSLTNGLQARLPGRISAGLPGRPVVDAAEGTDQIEAMAAAVAAAGEPIGHDLLVMIDDFPATEATDPRAGFVTALARHLPPRLHLVVASRRPAPLRISRLRAAAQVLDVDTGDLRLDGDDVDVASLGLEGSDASLVDELLRVTGGWPAAVRLGAEAMRRTDPERRPAVLERLVGPETQLFEFMAEEALADLDDDERDLLCLVAHLPHCSAALLAGAGLQRDAAALPRVAAERVFLERDGTRAGSYRTTALGREFLVQACGPLDEVRLARVIDTQLAQGDAAAALATARRLDSPELLLRVISAVERPEALGSPDEVLEALARARTVAPDDARAALDRLEGDVRVLSGDWEGALDCYRRLCPPGRPVPASIARRAGSILYLLGRLEEAAALLDATAFDGSDPVEETHALAWFGAIRWVRGDIEGSQALVERAEQRASHADDQAALAMVHTTKAMLAALHGDRRANDLHYVRALQHAEAAQDTLQLIRIRANRGSHFLEEGFYEEALAELGVAIDLADVAGLGSFAGLAHTNRGETNRRMGRLVDAQADLSRALQIWERTGSSMVSYALTQTGYIHLDRGETALGRSRFHEALRIAETEGDRQGLVPALSGLALSWIEDDPATARTLAARAASVEPSVWHPHALLVQGWAELRAGDAAAAVGHADAALTEAQAARQRPEMAEALLLRACAGEPPGLSDLEQSAELWRDIGNPIGEARTLVALAERRADERSVGLLRTAEQLLLRSGAWGQLARARQQLEKLTEEEHHDVSVVTLGGFRVYRGGEAVDVSEWRSRKARDLLRLLITRQGVHVPRDEVSEVLWPDEEPERSARRLSVLLSTLRSVLDPGKRHPADHYVGSDHAAVWLERHHLEIDVERFLADAAAGRVLLAQGRRVEAEASLAQAASRYAGDFGADDPYHDWTTGLREMARNEFIETSRALGRLADERGEHDTAVRHRLRILELDAYDEEAHLRLVEALLAQRRHGEARRAYRAYTNRMAELDVEAAPFPSGS